MNMVVNHFRNVVEMTTFLNSTPNNGIVEDTTKNEREFYGYSYKESLERVYSGIPVVTEKLKAVAMESNLIFTQNKNRKTRDYIGYAPNVPAYIMGQPKTMYKRTRVKQPVKTLNLVYNPCVYAGEKAETINKAGETFFKLAYSLESMGYRVKITIIPYIGIGNKEKAVCTVCVKNYQDMFDIQKLSFPLASVSMFRRLGFAWLEKAPLQGKESDWSGHGKPENDKTKQKDMVKESGYNINDAIFINLQDCRKANFDVKTLLDIVLKERERR